MTDDISYCASDCECINCIRNKANIRNPNILYSWSLPEEIPDCPLRILRELHYEDTNSKKTDSP